MQRYLAVVTLGLLLVSSLGCSSSEDPPLPCRTNADCDPDEACLKEDGDCAGPGTCDPRPDVCTAVVAPVCGCDAITYSNWCEAARARVSVASIGACP